MRYFHCPTFYRRKPYGCGRGPYNATQAMLDLWGKCPCGKKLVPFHPTRLAPGALSCAVTDMRGALYCTARVTEGAYCARHAYLNHSTPIDGEA